jgi:hypothetical protein
VQRLSISSPSARSKVMLLQSEGLFATCVVALDDEDSLRINALP